MPDIEDDMKLQNWLSVLTFDVIKYAKAGGQVVIDWTPDGLTLRLPGVEPTTPGIHNRFLIAAATATPAFQEQP